MFTLTLINDCSELKNGFENNIFTVNWCVIILLIVKIIKLCFLGEFSKVKVQFRFRSQILIKNFDFRIRIRQKVADPDPQHRC
jgi:hypothetical protein